MKIVGYTRVSTSEQGKSGLGLEAQAEYIRRFCEYGGHELVDIHVEVISGKFDIEMRPVLKRAFAQAEKAGATLLVSKLDRLSRNANFVTSLMSKSNRKFATVEDGLDVDPFQLHLKAILAEKERITIGQRTRDGMQAAIRRGQKIGGKTSGHEKAMVNAAAAVKADADAFATHMKEYLFRCRKAGMTVNAIAQELNEHNFRTARGGKWHASTVCNVLRRLEGGELTRLKRNQHEQ